MSCRRDTFCDTVAGASAIGIFHVPLSPNFVVPVAIERMGSAMSELLLEILAESSQIVILVFVMMVIVDLFNLWTKGRLGIFLSGGGTWRQYVLVPLVAAMPGCLGAFTAVSLYLHGMISFGVLAGAMIASSGDEAFVMLAMFPKTAVILFVLLSVYGMMHGWWTDKLMELWKIKPCTDCQVPTYHPLEGGLKHYVRDHVWKHIVQKHIWRTALWTVGALLVVRIGMEQLNLGALTAKYPFWTLVGGGLLGLIPESGPHLIVVTLFAKGAVPFSVLLTSSIVQDGHGMLPMLAHSVRDSLVLKAFNLASGLLLGIALFLFGF